MDRKLYHRRGLVETVISMLKRKYGAAVRSREWWRQFRELVALCLVYNLERAVRVGLILLTYLLALGQLSQGYYPSSRGFLQS